MKRVSVFIGTRPEAIKLAPVVRALRNMASVETRVVSSGQHGAMLSDALIDLEIHPDSELSALTHGQPLWRLSSSLLEKCGGELAECPADLVVVHGDTATALAAAHAAFLLGIPVAHVEAGLRTYDSSAPFPEEVNRQLLARLASLNFCPTEAAESNLLAESVPRSSIFMVGNTIVDSTVWVHGKLTSNDKVRTKVKECLGELGLDEVLETKFALVTLHRRENARDFPAILKAIREAAVRNPQFFFVFPVHPNPIISEAAAKELGRLHNVMLCKPLGYLNFMFLLSECTFVISDSGGIQEEGVTLSKRVMLIRDKTERPEGIASGYVELTGTNPERILSSINSHVSEVTTESILNTTSNPFGNGRASVRIAGQILALLNKSD